MKVGDKVRACFDHMIISSSTINDGNCFGEVGVVVGIDTAYTLYPIAVEFSRHNIPGMYKYKTCNTIGFKECELVLCN